MCFSFLLVESNLQFVSGAYGAKDLKTSLLAVEKLTYDDDGQDLYLDCVLKKAFDRNLERVLYQNHPLMRHEVERTLGFIRDAARVLSILELQTLLSITLSGGEPCQGDSPLWETIQQSCQGLITARDDHVYYLHESLERYLKQGAGLERIPTQNEQLGKRCTAYLTFEFCREGVCNTRESLTERLERWPLLDYAARYWQDHLTRFEQSLGHIVTPEDHSSGSFHTLALQYLRKDSHVEASYQITLFPDRGLQALRRETPANATAPWKIILIKDDGLSDPFMPNGFNGLHLACLYGYRTLAQKLIDERPREYVNEPTSEPIAFAPMHWAARGGYQDIVNILLDENADPGCRSSLGATPLIVAAMFGHNGVIDTLLQRAPIQGNINAQTRLPVDMEHQMIEFELRKKEDKLCVRNNFKVYAQADGRTALHFAAREGNIEALRTLLRSPHIDKNIQDSDGQTALHKAAKKGKLQVVKELIVSGMDPRLKVGEKPYALLDALFGSIKGLGGFVGAPAENSRGDFHHWTALHLASPYLRSIGVVEYLLRECPKLCTEVTPLGETPLHLAASAGVVRNMELLMRQSNVAINAVDQDGKTILHNVALAESAAGLELILEKGSIDVNAEDEQGWTPLHFAALAGEVENLRLLLKQQGIKVNHRDKKGRSALFKAAASRSVESFRLLLEHSEDGIRLEAAKMVAEEAIKTGKRPPLLILKTILHM